MSPDYRRFAIVDTARSWIGTPYRHQASVKGVGCDCLGLVLGVWREVIGEPPVINRSYSRDWAETANSEPLLDAANRHCHAVHDRDPLPGDLLIFRWSPHTAAKHVGFFFPGWKMIHALEHHDVRISTIVPQWRQRIAGVFTLPDT